jgi:hypothetical protein
MHNRLAICLAVLGMTYPEDITSRVPEEDEEDNVDATMLKVGKPSCCLN